MNPRTFVFFSLLLLLWVLPLASQDAKPDADQCLTCHLELGSPEARSFEKDIHHLAGITCAGCHGGDDSATEMENAMDPKKGFIDVPLKTQIPKVCETCHVDEVRDFEQSVHGKALQESFQGPQCISCHGIHNIVSVDDKRSPVFATSVTKTCSKCHSNPEYMKLFNPGLPVDQYAKYLTSVHGKRNAAGDPKVATCVSCHSNHLVYAVKDPRAPVYPMKIPATCAKCHGDSKYMAEYHISTKQYDDYLNSIHGIALLKNSDLSAPACNSCHGNHGAAPPGVNSVANVCGQCHPSNAELYDKSIHHAVFEARSLPGCVVCHGNHRVESPADSMIGFDADSSICGHCHANLAADKASATVRAMRETLDGLTGGQTEASRLLNQAEQMGMDVSEAEYSLKDVNQSLIETRVKVHSFNKVVVAESAKPGMKAIAQAKESAHAAIQEYYFRRKGLGVSTLLLTILAVLLYLKIREIEAGGKKD
jgi:Cytochrome c554 and c-prime